MGWKRDLVADLVRGWTGVGSGWEDVWCGL